LEGYGQSGLAIHGGSAHVVQVLGLKLSQAIGGMLVSEEAQDLGGFDAPITSSTQARNPQAAASQNAPDGLAEFEAEHLDNMRAAAMNGEAALSVAFQALPKGPHKVAFWQAHQSDLKDAASKAQIIDAAEVQ